MYDCLFPEIATPSTRIVPGRYTGSGKGLGFPAATTPPVSPASRCLALLPLHHQLLLPDVTKPVAALMASPYQPQHRGMHSCDVAAPGGLGGGVTPKFGDRNQCRPRNHMPVIGPGRRQRGGQTLAWQYMLPDPLPTYLENRSSSTAAAAHAHAPPAKHPVLPSPADRVASDRAPAARS
jgi:hypothetical protein